MQQGEHAARTAPAGNQDLATPSQAWRLCVKGLSAAERQLLDGAVALSQRRMPRLQLVGDAHPDSVDIVMIDGRDPLAMRWAAHSAWLKDKPAVWIDADPPAASGQLAVRRPVTWPTLSVMLSRALEHKQQSQRQHQVRGSGRRAVLVVDDSLPVRVYVRSLLESRGVAVVDVDNPEAGVAAALRDSYACVLMDVLMPGIDGYEACRRIKSQGRPGHTPPVVMLTSRSSPFDRIRGKLAGCDAYLGKPVDAGEFYGTLGRFIEGLGGEAGLPHTAPMPA